MNTLYIGVVPHLIPSATVPAKLIDRAHNEPLAEGRDEVIYMICTHDRLAIGRQQERDGRYRVFRAVGAIGGPFRYVTDGEPVAKIQFPDGTGPSELGWAVIDPLLESVEGLVPDSSFDATKDPEGEAGRHRHELLPWLFDRHLELGREPDVFRGKVEGGRIEFNLEYVGQSESEALRRAAGSHHKMPLIYARTLSYDPHRLVYILPCDIRVARGAIGDNPEMSPLVEAVARTGLTREVLVSAAEESLIAGVGAPHNSQNTGTRSFPNSHTGELLASAGIQRVLVAFRGLPDRTSIYGKHREIRRDSQAIAFDIAGQPLPPEPRPATPG